MARVLSRPMFRRGGNVNSGIVSGFNRGGTVPKRGLVDAPGGYAGEELAMPTQRFRRDLAGSYITENKFKRTNPDFLEHEEEQKRIEKTNKLLMDKDFNNLVANISEKVIDSGETDDENSSYFGLNHFDVYNKVMQDLISAQERPNYESEYLSDNPDFLEYEEEQRRIKETNELLMDRDLLMESIPSNNDIIGGFNRGGTVPKRGLVDSPGGYAGEEYAELAAKYMQEPVEQKGMTSGDWLRVASSGAEIMSAEPTGRGGWIGALQAAGKPLGKLGTDLATSKDLRRSNYLTRKNAYDAALAGAAVSGKTAEVKHAHEAEQLGTQIRSDEGISSANITSAEKMQNLLLTHNVSESSLDRTFKYDALTAEYTFQHQKIKADFKNAVALLKADKKLNPYAWEKEYVLGEGAELKKIMATSAKDSIEYKDAKTAFLFGLHGETMRALAEEKANLLMDKDFNNLVADISDKVIDSGETDDENSVYYGLNPSEVINKVMQALFSQVIEKIHIPPGLAHGGRVGLQQGGNPQMMAQSMEQPMPQPEGENIELSFVELRKRLPPEVSDAIINLILNSEEAMIDFAKLQTQEDVSIFNQKYNSDLQIPQQVA